MPVKYRQVPLSELHFDPDNPRIPLSVDASDEQEVLDWMLSDAGLIELMGSIAEKGYFPAEALLVMPNPEGSGYLVLEGNRRLAAVRLLTDPSRAPRRKRAVAETAARSNSADLEALPCAIFQARREVLDYLGYRHITGIKQWEPSAKARYLDELYVEHVKTSGQDVYRKIARIIGSRADYVSRLLGSLRLFETIFDPDNDATFAEEEVSFSLLTLSLNYASIIEYLELKDLSQESFRDVNRDHLSSLAKWLYHEDPDLGRTQLGDSRNMKLLATAVGHPEGLESLNAGATAEQAATATVDAGELFLRALRTAKSHLLSAQSLLHRAPVPRLAINTLEEIEEVTSQLISSAARKQRRDARENV